MKKLNIKVLSENIENRVSRDFQLKNVSGVSIAVFQCGKLIYKKHFGTASAQKGEPVSDNTLFRLASMTKPITAVAIMTLCEKGLLALDDRVEKYLPDFKDIKVIEFANGAVKNTYNPETKITIRHLLTHSSGLLAGDVGTNFFPKMTDKDRLTLNSAVKFYAKTGLGFEPFTATEYSGVAAFDVLGKIAEIVTDIPFDRYLKEEIFIPLNMLDTTFAPASEQWQRVIDMYIKENAENIEGTIPEGFVFENIPVSHIAAGAGLVSSLSDYSKFAQMLLNGGEFEGKRIISEDSIKQISTYQIPVSVPDQFERWGLGVRVVTEDSSDTCLPVGAFGWSGAYGTHFWVDPQNNVVALYMKNSRYDGGSGAVTAHNFEKDVVNSFER